MVSQNSLQKKKKEIKNLSDKMKNSKTIMVVSLKGVPSKQFQEIKKKVRKEAEVKVAKKNILKRAIDGTKEKEIEKLKEYIEENSAIVLSDSDAFDLAGILAENKNPVLAKAGQEALEDIKVEAGPTELVPGPAISELGGVGLKVTVEGGKLSIKEGKVIVKKNEKISPEVASVLQKLDIKPFLIGLEPLVLYDKNSKKIFINIKIDKEKAVGDLKNSKMRAFGLAQKIVYYCKETIGYLLGKANLEVKKIETLSPVSEGKAPEKEKPEEGKEEKEKESAEKEVKEKKVSEENKEDKTQENKTQEEK